MTVKAGTVRARRQQERIGLCVSVATMLMSCRRAESGEAEVLDVVFTPTLSGDYCLWVGRFRYFIIHSWDVLFHALAGFYFTLRRPCAMDGTALSAAPKLGLYGSEA